MKILNLLPTLALVSAAAASPTPFSTVEHNSHDADAALAKREAEAHAAPVAETAVSTNRIEALVSRKISQTISPPMQFLEPLTRKPAEIPILCRAYIGGDTDKIKREAARLSRRTAEAHAAPVAETAVYWAYLGGAAEAEAAHLPKRAAEANANANANAAPVAETAVYWAYLEEAEKLED